MKMGTFQENAPKNIAKFPLIWKNRAKLFDCYALTFSFAARN